MGENSPWSRWHSFFNLSAHQESCNVLPYRCLNFSDLAPFEVIFGFLGEGEVEGAYQIVVTYCKELFTVLHCTTRDEEGGRRVMAWKGRRSLTVNWEQLTGHN